MQKYDSLDRVRLPVTYGWQTNCMGNTFCQRLWLTCCQSEMYKKCEYYYVTTVVLPPPPPGSARPRPFRWLSGFLFSTTMFFYNSGVPDLIIMKRANVISSIIMCDWLSNHLTTLGTVRLCHVDRFVQISQRCARWKRCRYSASTVAEVAKRSHCSASSRFSHAQSSVCLHGLLRKLQSCVTLTVCL